VADRKWNTETAALIERFMKMEPAASGFELRSGVTVIDPVAFHVSLKGDIATGPNGARARLGALQNDLRDYVAKRT